MRRIITALVGLSMVVGVGVASASPHGGGSRGGGSRGGGGRSEHVSHGGGEVRGGGGYRGGGEVRGGGYRGGGEVRGGGERYYGGRGYERGYGGAHFRDYGARPGWRYNERYEYRSGYAWTGGDWYWDGAEWVWAPGHYVRLRVW